MDAPNTGDAAAQKLGDILVLELSTANSTFASGAFATDRDTVSSSRDDGPCHVNQTDHVISTLESAGAVTISGGTGTSIVMSPDANNQYVATVQGLHDAANDVLSVSAVGATVPASGAGDRGRLPPKGRAASPLEHLTIDPRELEDVAVGSLLESCPYPQVGHEVFAFETRVVWERCGNRSMRFA